MRTRLCVLGVFLLSLCSINSYAQVLINEDFSTATGTTPPAGWANIDSTTSGEIWTFNNPGSRTLNAPISSPAAIFDSDFNGSGAAEDAYLATPAFNASTAVGSIFLSFDHYFRSGFGGSYEVQVYNGTAWTTVLSGGASSSADPASETVDITTAAGASASAQVRFRWQGNYSWYWILDNVKVEVISCTSPTALGSTNTTASSADVYWTGGGAAHFNVEYGATGFTPGTGTVVNASNDTLTLTSLSANTNYDFYVRDSCGVGNVSSYSGPVSFRTSCLAALSGTYTINAGLATGGTNYASFTEAVSALNSCGVSGPVIFNVVQGTYTEQITIDSIQGASATNTVVFQSDAANTAAPVLTYASTASSANYVVRIDNADYLTIDGLTLTAAGTIYGRVIELDGASEHITISNNTLNGLSGVTSTSSNYAVIYNYSGSANLTNNSTVNGNTISGGSYAFYWYGSGTTLFETGNTITNNTITDFYNYGIAFYYQDGGVISNNVITSSTSASSTVYGISNYYSDNSSVTANAVTVYASSTAYGIYNYYNDATSGAPNMIANNMVACLGNTGTTYGIYPFNNYYTEIVYNTVSVNAGSATAGRALYINSSSSGTYGFVNILNNNISNTGGGYAAEVSANAVTLGYVTSSNYNNIFGTGATLVRVGSTNFTDLASYQTGASLDANSVSADPLFVGASDLHVLSPAINGVASPYAGITVDIDGDARSATTPDIGADEFTPPACGPSSGFTSYAVAANSVSVNWAPGNGVSFVVEHGPAGFVQGAGTTVAVSDTFAVISGLMPETAYDFYLQDVCGGGNGSSPFIGPVSVTTTCASIAVFPFVEDFETSTSSIPACWENDPNDDADWIFRSGSIGHGSTTDHTLGTSAGYYAGMDDSHSSTNDTLNNLLTPSFDLTSLTAPELEFYYFIGNDNVLTSKLIIDVYDGTNWNMNVATVTYTSASWLKQTVSLTAYKSTATKIRFRGVETTDFNSDVSIDDIKVQEAPACPSPTLLDATGILSTSASLYWTTGGASAWNVEYGATGFTPGTGTLVAATNDTLAISNLTSQTTYDFYVQDDCGAGVLSTWVGPVSFTTTCAPLSPPQLEDFSTGFVPTACWDEATSGTPTTGPSGFGSGDWTEDGFGNNGTTGAIKVNLYNLGTEDWALTPSYDLTTGGPYQVEFDFGVFVWTSGSTGSAPATLGSDDEVQFLISTNGGTSWTSLATYNSTYVTAASGNHEVFDLTAYAGSTVSFAFYATEGTVDDTEDNDVFMDNFEVKVKPVCPDVSGVNLISATDTSVTFYWTGGTGNWNVQYGDTTGFVLGSGTVVASTNDTITINGLTASTTYVFYVQNDCGTGGVSAYVGPLQVTTNCSVLPLPYIETFEVASSTTLACVSAQANWALAAVGGYGTSSNSLTFPFYNVSSGVFSAFSPQFAPTPANYQLSVDHAKAAYTTEADSIKIYYSTDGGASYTLLVGLDGSATGALSTAAATTSQFVPGATDWSTYSIALPTGVNRVRIDALTDYGNDLFLDNLSIDAIPSCGLVTGYGVDTVFGSTGIIYWTADATSIGSMVEYGPVGFTPGTGTVLNAQNDTLTINNLTANECYDVYIQDTCAGGIAGGLAGPFKLCAACVTFTAPFFEGFETLGAVIPNCWSSFSTTGEVWRYTSTGIGHSATTGANGSTFFAAFDDSENPATSDGVLETPMINISSLTTPTLSFYLWSDAEDGSGVTAGGVLNATIDVAVLVGTSWDTVFTNTGNTNGWEFFYVDLSGLNITGPTQVRFIVDEDHDLGFDDDISIDDIFVGDRTPCFDPLNLAVTAIGLNSVGLSWDSDTTVNSSIIEYGAPGFALGSGTQVASAAGMGTVTGLNSATCYDFYVLDSCTGGFTSWLGPINVCTAAPCVVSTTPTGVNDSTGCGGGYVALSAAAGNGNSDVAWISNGIVIAVSDTVADTIGGTTILQAHDYSASGVAVHVGPLPSIAAAGFGNFTNGQFITVLDTIYIDSTTVRSDGFVNAQVIIRDAAGVDILQRGTVFETPATGTVNTQVPVDILLVPGNYFIGIDFDITAVSTGSLFRATTGAVFPYTAPGLLEITGVNFAGPRYYYTFDLVLRGACLGAPTQVMGYVPGASAGNDASASICETETAFNLASLVGAHTGGGTWTDLSTTGALTDSIFNATISGPGGPFNFRYIVSGAGGCANDTSFVTLSVDTILNAGTSATAAFCTSSSAFVSLRPLIGADGGGTWADLDNSGILVSDRIRPNQGTPGVYRFEYTQPANGTCPAASAILIVTLSAPVDAGADASDSTCVSKAPIDLSTYLSAGATAGGTWIDVNSSGGLSGSTFTTSGVVGNTTYNFRYKVQGAVGCPDDSATVSIYVCDDFSINEQALSTVQLYPNPTSGVFFVEDMDRSTRNFTVEVLSVDGKLLRSFDFTNTGKQTVDITALAAGVYHVKVSTDKGVKVFKVIAQD